MEGISIDPIRYRICESKHKATIRHVSKAFALIASTASRIYFYRKEHMHYLPLSFPFFVAFAILFILLVVIIEIGILGYAYEKIGINQRYMFTLLFFSLWGSYINIPVAELPAEYIETDKIISFFGMQYVVPMLVGHPRTIIAVNLGGAVIPVLVSMYLVIKNRLYVKALWAVVIMTIIIHQIAYPVPGLGIAEPTLIPPLVTAGVVLLIDRVYAAPLSYVAGCLGTLIGADLLNLNKISGLGAPVASIGGAGTFDGIFLTGITSVLLASLLRSEKKMDT